MEIVNELLPRELFFFNSYRTNSERFCLGKFQLNSVKRYILK